MEETKEKVGPGKYVTYFYKLYDATDNKLLFETPKDRPDFMVYGVTPGIVPGLEAAMEGLSAGDRFEVELPAAAAFGDINPDFVMTLDKDIFMRDGKLAEEVKIGARLPMMTAEGFRVEGVVKEITPDKIVMDFNHPFAGLTVKYEGEVEGVRDATPEEMQPSCGCGGGCGDSGCGGGCGDGCGSSGCGCQ